MAKNSKCLAISSLVFLLLILSQEIAFVNGRHLKCRKCSKGHHRNSSKGGKRGGGSAAEQASKVEYVEDFRPTAPGHSPGIGHSVHD